MPPAHDPEKETIFVHDLTPELERELTLRAQARHRDASAEAAEIIERHVEEESGGIA
jgi:plasmid stability protein